MLPATERDFPLLLSVITYEVTEEPPSSVPTKATQLTVAEPTPTSTVGLFTAFGKVVGVETNEFEDQGLTSWS
jgi:hypothetical protein